MKVKFNNTLFRAILKDNHLIVFDNILKHTPITLYVVLIRINLVLLNIVKREIWILFKVHELLQRYARHKIVPQSTVK